jgi:hypothetical protein
MFACRPQDGNDGAVVAITAGTFFPVVGFAQSLMGSISPASATFARHTVFEIADNPANYFLFMVDDPTHQLLQNAFYSITINGTTRLSSAATTFGANGNNTQWVWPTPVGLVNGTTYSVSIA